MTESWSEPTNWAADVKKYAPDADDGVIAGLVRYCGIALRSRDASMVSFGDAEETGRVRENFLKKKLELTLPDEELDRAIAKVGERMSDTHFRNRVTVYYLLLEHFGLQHRFGRATDAAGAAAGAAGVGAAALAAGEPVHDEPAEPEPAKPAPTAGIGAAAAGIGVAAAGAAAAGAAAVSSGVSQSASGAAPWRIPANEPSTEGKKGGLGWLPWAILCLAIAALLAWFLLRNTGAPPVPAPATAAAPAVAPAAPTNTGIAAAPPEGQVAIPAGAGVTVETRDGKPVVKVYFDSGKTAVAPAFADPAAGLKSYLDDHAGSSLVVSGFNDPTGNAAANALLSKHRAEAVKADLVAAGIPDTLVALAKPSEATDTAVAGAAARRAEITVK